LNRHIFALGELTTDISLSTNWIRGFVGWAIRELLAFLKIRAGCTVVG
jgi:hypothetical protein